MDTYDVLVASYVYSFLDSVDWEEVKDEEALRIFREVSNTYITFAKRSGWEEMLNTLEAAERKLRVRRSRAKDEEAKEALSIWIVLVVVLKAVVLVRQGKYEEALKMASRAQRMAHRLKYVEPFVVSAALTAALKFRLGEAGDFTLLQSVSLTLDEPHLKALAFEVLAYILSEISSDAAFSYAVLYWGAIKDMEGMELFAHLERLYRIVDTILLRLAYELKSGKVLPDEVEWPEDTDAFFDWAEKGSDNEVINVALMNLYVKLLHYATLRSESLKGDPLKVAERLKRANKKLRMTIEALINSLREDDEDEGKYDNILKA